MHCKTGVRSITTNLHPDDDVMGSRGAFQSPGGQDGVPVCAAWVRDRGWLQIGKVSGDSSILGADASDST